MLQSDGTPRELAIHQGGWSDWLRVKFKVGLLQSIRGMVRFHLVQCEPELALYASPINFDPDSPFFPISDPPEYAGELAQRIGLYYTTGMVEDHAGLNNERISEETFLDQCEIVWREREAMMLHELESFESGFSTACSTRPTESSICSGGSPSPITRPTAAKRPAADFAGVIDDCYRRCDAIVGKALEFSDDETLFIALSDHGFNSFRAAFT